MSITKLPEIVFPLTQINKVNEIVDVLNDNLNMYYSAENPALTPIEGVATWTVTHNLGTENVNCSLYNGDNLVISNVSITSENVVTVSFNAQSAISAGTYKIVVISNGAGSSSGSGSYVLPTASTTTLGGVRIDGSSIKINNGVISSTVDSTLSETSTNPVQNKVISSYVKPAIDNYLPDGTIITVDPSGSGDFTTLADAISFIEGKWSEGTVTIDLSESTHTLSSDVTIYCQRFNFAKLFIRSNSPDKMTLTGGVLNVRDAGTPVMIQGINFYEPNATASTNIRGLTTFLQATVRLYSCAFNGKYIFSYGNSIVNIDTVSFSNSRYSIGVQSGASFDLSGTISFNNVNTCIFTRYGGKISINNPVMTFTNCSIEYRTWDNAQSYNPTAGTNFFQADSDGIIGGKFRAS